MAEYRFEKLQTLRCDMKDKKFSIPYYQIISKTGQTHFFLYELDLSISAQIEDHKAFSVDHILKKTKIKMGNLSWHTVTQGFFHQYHFENFFS